jgi:ABC-type transporter MlaC component
MKTIGIFLVSLVFTLTCFAQESEFTKMMREMYHEEFVEIVDENMNLTAEQNEIFKPIFEEFLSELIPIMDSKLVNQGKFSEYFDTMTDEQVEEIFKNIWTINKNYNDVMKKYTDRISKAINPQSSFRFFLIVEKVSSTFEYSVIQNIPLVKN